MSGQGYAQNSTAFAMAMAEIKSGRPRKRKYGLDDLAILALYTESSQLRSKAIAVLDALDPDWRPDWVLDEMANGARWRTSLSLHDVSPELAAAPALPPPPPFRRLSEEEKEQFVRFVTDNPGCRVGDILTGLQWESLNRVRNIAEKVQSERRVYRRRGQFYQGKDPEYAE